LSERQLIRRYAVFDTLPNVRRALERLAADGVAAGDIEIRSMIPLGEDLVPAGIKLRSRVPLLAILGGVFGGSVGYYLATLPPAIGGLAAVSGPPIAVITFEGAAVGAILLCVATVLFECGLPRLRWSPGPFDHHVAAGNIVVAVAVDGDENTTSDWASAALATELRRHDGTPLSE